MSIDYNEDRGTVLVWMTNSDQQNPIIISFVEEMKEKYKNTKTKLVVFKSGSGDLTALTQSLFSRNKNCY